MFPGQQIWTTGRTVTFVCAKTLHMHLVSNHFTFINLIFSTFYNTAGGTICRRDIILLDRHLRFRTLLGNKNPSFVQRNYLMFYFFIHGPDPMWAGFRSRAAS